jgi:uncharacterized membrane protein YdbT with pleckstrin-like domain
MSYLAQILEPGETVRCQSRPSWTIYAPTIGLAACGLAALIVSVVDAGAAYFAGPVAIVLAAATLAAFVPAWVRRWTTEIAVTDRRVILKRGLVRRRTVEMNMQKVESVDVDQTALGRLFNYGDVTIRGAGGAFEKLRRIDAPLKLRTAVTAG